MGIEEYMHSIIKRPLSIEDIGYTDVEKKYEETFGHVVPREMIPLGIPKESILLAMQKCVDENNDKLFELLGVSVSDKYMY